MSMMMMTDGLDECYTFNDLYQIWALADSGVQVMVIFCTRLWLYTQNILTKARLSETKIISVPCCPAGDRVDD